MKDENVDEKLKDIEKEIDHAIDQLFVDKTSPEKPPPEVLKSDETTTPSEEREQSQDISTDAVEGEKMEETTAEEAEIDTGNEYSQIIETLQSKVEAFTEWGVTDTALEKVLSGIKEIKEVFSENRFIESVAGMITEVLEFLGKNQASHVEELVEFLVSAFNSLKMLIQPRREEGTITDEEVFNAINSQFSEISSLLTFDIDTIELEEVYAIPGEDKGEQKPVREVSEGPAGEVQTEGESKGTQKANTTIESQDVEASFTKSEKASHEEVEKFKTEEEIDTLEIEATETQEAEPALELPEERAPEKTQEEITISKETLSAPFAKFHELTNELAGTLQQMKEAFFEANAISEIMEKLSIEVDTLNTLTNRFVAVTVSGIPSENDLKLLQKSVSEIGDDFEALANLLSPEEMRQLEVEEIVPVVVGKKMIGLSSQSIGMIYSISQGQENRFRSEGSINLGGEKIPFIDLFEEYSEISANPNKRLIIVDSDQGKKALLSDRVLKRRFVLISKSEVPHALRRAKFFFTEEIPVYEAT